MDIEFEVFSTWPRALKDLLELNRENILRYHLERIRIDTLAEEEIRYRVYRPYNEFEDIYGEIVEKTVEILRTERIIGYHCTRLTESESSDIIKNGLKILNLELIKTRLKNALLDNHLDQEGYDFLVSSEIVSGNLNNEWGQRTNYIWFCPNRSTLKESSGVYRLFRSWGGEVIYSGLERDPSIAPKLTKIGRPCIVKCAIPFDTAQTIYQNIPERFVSIFIHDEIECPEPSSNFDMFCRRDLRSEEILDIIERSNAGFSRLTACETWRKNYNIDEPLMEFND